MRTSNKPHFSCLSPSSTRRPMLRYRSRLSVSVSLALSVGFCACVHVICLSYKFFDCEFYCCDISAACMSAFNLLLDFLIVLWFGTALMNLLHRKIRSINNFPGNAFRIHIFQLCFHIFVFVRCFRPTAHCFIVSVSHIQIAKAQVPDERNKKYELNL